MKIHLTENEARLLTVLVPPTGHPSRDIFLAAPTVAGEWEIPDDLVQIDFVREHLDMVLDDEGWEPLVVALARTLYHRIGKNSLHLGRPAVTVRPQ